MLDQPEFRGRFEEALAEVASASASGRYDEHALAMLVAHRVVELLDVSTACVARFDEGQSTVLGAAGPLRLPDHASLGAPVVAELLRTGRPVRFADYADLEGELTPELTDQELGGVIGVPVHIEGALWGGLFAGQARPAQVAPFAERLLERFVVLISAALANAETQRRLLEEARVERVLREIASASATGQLDERALASLAAVQLAELLDATTTVVARLTGDDLTTLGYCAPSPPPAQFPLSEVSLAATVARTGKPSRVDDRGTLTGRAAAMAAAQGLMSAISVPVHLEGRLWGTITAGTRQARGFTQVHEQWLERFGALVAVSLAHSEAAAALRHSEERYRMVVEASSDGIADVDMSTGRLWWSPRLMRSLGYTPETFGATQEWVNEQVVHPEDRRRLARSLIGALDESTTVLRMRAADGAYRTMVARSALERDDNRNVVRRVSIYTDVTDRDRAEAKRVALARELHNSVVAELASARTGVSTARRVLERRPEMVGAALEALEAPLASAEDNMRLVVQALRSDTTLLDARGAISALTDTLARELRRRDPKLEVLVNDALDEGFEAGPTAAATYGHVLREALLNVLRHAEAGQVTIDVGAPGDMLRLRIADDGVGFDAAGALRRGDLRDMRERVLAAGGTFDLDTTVGRGTVIVTELPRPLLDPPSDALRGSRALPAEAPAESGSP